MSDRFSLHDAVILVVDDEEMDVRLVARILALAGFTQVHTTCDPADVLRLYNELAPDLIMLDVHMPKQDGFAVLAQIRERIAATDYFPVLALTGDLSPETRKAVIVAGAKDYLAKPFEASEVIVRVRNLLTTRMLHRSLQNQNDLLEQKVRARTAELEVALAAAEAASLAKSQFLATMSHELRTPLNAVIGFAQHLQKNKPGNLLPQDLTFLDRIRDNGARLLQIISDILDLSRIEAGKMPVESSSVVVSQLIHDIVDQVISTNVLSQKPVSVRVSIPDNLAPIVTDATKLRCVLSNLIGNAAKFTDNGHILIGITADASGRPLRLDVVDTGVGIASDRLTAIFAIFEQADNSTQRRFGGTGLGLAVSRTLCELLAYRLSVVSQPGVGSAFTILLDAAEPAPSSYAELAVLYTTAVGVTG